MSLRKKYDDLVEFTVTLTAERDKLNRALEKKSKELKSYEKLADASASGKSDAFPTGVRRRKGAGDDGQTDDAVDTALQGDGSQYLWWHVLVVAVLCFAMGRVMGGGSLF